MIPGRKQGLLIYGGIFGLALTARGIPLLTAELWRDEAVVGIMSLRVLAGEFPVFFFGQNFMGALEAYLSAVLILFLGPRAWVLELLPVTFPCCSFFSWKVGPKTVSGSGGSLRLLILAIPPLFLLKWSHEARSHYPLTLVLGTLVVYHGLQPGLPAPRRRPNDSGAWAPGPGRGVGLVDQPPDCDLPAAGIFFALGDEKKIIFRWPAPLLLVAFLLGSLPLHLYRFRQQAPGLGIPGLLSLPDPGSVFSDFFQNALPILLGCPPAPVFRILERAGLPVYAGALRRGPDLLAGAAPGRVADLLRLRKGRTDGSELLFLVMLPPWRSTCLRCSAGG